MQIFKINKTAQANDENVYSATVPVQLIGMTLPDSSDYSVEPVKVSFRITMQPTRWGIAGYYVTLLQIQPVIATISDDTNVETPVTIQVDASRLKSMDDTGKGRITAEELTVHLNPDRSVNYAKSYIGIANF